MQQLGLLRKRRNALAREAKRLERPRDLERVAQSPYPGGEQATRLGSFPRSRRPLDTGVQFSVAAVTVLHVMLDHARQEHCAGEPVRDMLVHAQRIRHRSGRTSARVEQRDASQIAPEHETRAILQVLRLPHNGLERVENQPERLERQETGDWGGALGDEALVRVHQRIHARRDGHAPRAAHRERGVEYAQFGDVELAIDAKLALLPRVDENGVRGHLAGGAGSRGERDHRRSRLSDKIKPPILNCRAGVRHQNRERLSQIQCAPPAHDDEAVDRLAHKRRSDFVQVVVGRLGHRGLQARRDGKLMLQRCLHAPPRGVPGRSAIDDQSEVLPVEPPEVIGQFVGLAHPETEVGLKHEREIRLSELDRHV